MKLYLDDDSVDGRLVAELRKLQHEVVVPVDVKLNGAKDARHMIHALRERLVLLTSNYYDFDLLHQVIIASGGHHAGILLIRKDNDRARDMKVPMIISCVGRLERAGVPIADQVHVLGHWR
jgi:hypothetical protein